MTSDDNLTAVHVAFDDEINAAADSVKAQSVVVDLIQVGADVEAIFAALDEVWRKMEANRVAYNYLEQLLQRAGWCMSKPETLPPALQAALDSQVPQHQRILARSDEAERVITTWINEQNQRHFAQRYWAGRRWRESHQLNRRADRRRRHGG
jgi:hypothetical protein